MSERRRARVANEAPRSTRAGRVLWWLAWPVPLLWRAIGALTQWTLAFQD
ncbi:hypothetical protein GCM10023165_34410 [Variovorax defluvii]|uniref:Uncharacterized protein n=1 Tax=Variovorax defluvii TaxID=913761 RepID=A0ABP8I0C3_9BURK